MPEKAEDGYIDYETYKKYDFQDKKIREQLSLDIKQRQVNRDKHILKGIGDISDPEAEPDDNVLFVCKLNKLTLEE